MAEVEMAIESIRVSLVNQQRVIALKEKEGARYLPCWIGAYEADIIDAKMKDKQIPVPLFPDFLCAAIRSLGGEVKSVIIDKFANDTYFAKTRIEHEGNIIEIDCRPSDAMAVAVTENVPIFANEDVINEVGLTIDPKTGKLIM